MYKLTGRKQLGRKASHRKLMVRNQIRSIFQAGHVTTTTPKAKVLKANIESVLVRIKGVGNNLSAMRELQLMVGGRESYDRIVDYLAKNAGSVRIVKVGFRPGDNAEKSTVTLVDYLKEKATAAKKVVKKSAKQVTEAGENAEIEEKQPKQEKGNVTDISGRLAKTLRTTFGGGKERVRTRSGL